MRLSVSPETEASQSGLVLREVAFLTHEEQQQQQPTASMFIFSSILSILPL